jgi:hypothetical protein
MKTYGEVEEELHAFVVSALYGSEESGYCSLCLITGKTDADAL